MKDQSFTSIEQQIFLLKQRGLSFRSESSAASILTKYGYYNVINGYKDNYVLKDQETERYREGITFEQIYSLFILDHTIRNTIMLAMLDIEEMLKTNAAYVVGESLTSDYQRYSDIRNYKNIPRGNPRFSLNRILQDLDKAYHSDRDPIKYHRENYGNVPPWVLFKGVYLSTMVNYVRFFKSAQKDKLIYLLLGIEKGSPIDPALKKYFSDILYLFLEYRNLCAHGGRIYNFHPLSDPVFDPALLEQINVNNGKSKFDSIGRLAICFMSWRDNAPIINLRNIVRQEVQRHCLSFPEDKEFILNSMDIKDIPLFDLSE